MRRLSPATVELPFGNMDGDSMIDWAFIELLRASIFDVLRTAIFAVGGWVAFIQLRESYRLRRLQTLSSFNERLASCATANKWIGAPDRQWAHLDEDIKYDFQNYISTFEDIGVARNIGILTKDDFIASYGGRFEQLHKSGTLPQFMTSAGFSPANFKNLRILLQDIGQDADVYFNKI